MILPLTIRIAKDISFKTSSIQKKEAGKKRMDKALLSKGSPWIERLQKLFLLMPMIYLKGIFYTKNGQCLECKPVRLVKQIENKQYDRLAILFNMRRDWQSYRFQEIDEKHLPSLSILDFAIIPLKKPHLQKEEEKNQNAGRRTYNLFKKKTNTKD